MFTDPAEKNFLATPSDFAIEDKSYSEWYDVYRAEDLR